MPILSILFLLLSILLTNSLFAQFNRDDVYLPLSSQKSTIDYFDTVDDKSYYQRQRIHGMKRDINDYSQRLHTLQQRFDEIFYGLSGNKSFDTPFDLSQKPTRPVSRQLLEETSVSPVLNPRAGETFLVNDQSDLIETSKITPSENQLAFQVDGPGSFVQDDKTMGLFKTKGSNSGALGKYFIISPGLAIPYKIHKPNPSASKTSYRRYDLGAGLNLAGGFEKNGFRFGLGGMFKTNKHHGTSYEKIGATKTHFENYSRTFAGFLDVSYRLRLFGSLDGFAGIGLGYYLSLIEAPRKRKDHGLFASGNLGLAYNLSELISLSLGYRYVHEEEVPAHLAELGLDFDF